MITKNLSILKFTSGLLVLSFATCSGLFNKTLVPAGQLMLKPVLGFEFARNSSDIKTLFINADGSPACQFIKDICFSIQIDNLFIVAYVSFMVFFAVGVIKFQRPAALGIAALLIALSVGVFDFLENREMIKIAEFASGYAGSFEGLSLSKLQIFTWTKWLSCGIYMALIAVYLWNKNLLHKVIAIIAAATFLLGITAFVAVQQDCQKFLPWFTLGVFASLAPLILISIFQYFSENWKRV